MISAKWTKIVFSSLVGLALIWEIVSLFLGQDATISEFIWQLVNYPFFSFSVGILMGHWFWQRNNCINCGKNPIRREH